MKYFTVDLFRWALSQAFSRFLTLDRFRLRASNTAPLDMSFFNITLWLLVFSCLFFTPLQCFSPSVRIPLPPVYMPLLDTAHCWHINWIGNYFRLHLGHCNKNTRPSRFSVRSVDLARLQGEHLNYCTEVRLYKSWFLIQRNRGVCVCHVYVWGIL